MLHAVKAMTWSASSFSSAAATHISSIPHGIRVSYSFNRRLGTFLFRRFFGCRVLLPDTGWVLQRLLMLLVLVSPLPAAPVAGVTSNVLQRVAEEFIVWPPVAFGNAAYTARCGFKPRDANAYDIGMTAQWMFTGYTVRLIETFKVANDLDPAQLFRFFVFFTLVEIVISRLVRLFVHCVSSFLSCITL